MAQKQSDKKPPKHIEFGNYKIQSQKVPYKEDQYLWKGIYRDIRPAFWDDIYEAFDSQYFGENKINIFLQHWDAWYDELVSTYKLTKLYDEPRVDGCRTSFMTQRYPSPWMGCRGDDSDISPHIYDIQARWRFIQTLKPPTQNISHHKRVIKKDLEDRKKRDKCQYANVYSILLLKKTYYEWINENQPILSQDTQVYTGVSLNDIADQIINSKYREFVFCGAIPYFLLSEKSYKYFRKNSISSSSKIKSKRHTFIISSPNTDNIQALSKLRRKLPQDILLDVFNTHSVLIELALLSKHTKEYIRILYVDDIPAYDYFVIDNCKCLLSLDIDDLRNGNDILSYYQVTRNKMNLRTVLCLTDSRLIQKCRNQILDIWISNLKEYSLNQFVCDRSGIDSLNISIMWTAAIIKDLNLNEEEENELSVAHHNLLSTIRELRRDNYLPPDESIFSKFYGYLYINTDQEKIFEDARRYKREDFNFRGIEEEISLKLGESRDELTAHFRPLDP